MCWADAALDDGEVAVVDSHLQLLDLALARRACQHARAGQQQAHHETGSADGGRAQPGTSEANRRDAEFALATEAAP